VKGGAFDQDLMDALNCCTSLPAARILENLENQLTPRRFQDRYLFAGGEFIK
jgi:hypothetical protein